MTSNNLVNTCVGISSVFVTTAHVYNETDLDTLAKRPISSTLGFVGLSCLYGFATDIVMGLIPEKARVPVCGVISALAGYNIYRIYQKKKSAESAKADEPTKPTDLYNTDKSN